MTRAVTKFEKGAKVAITYRDGSECSAFVLTAHKDGEYTVKRQFPMDATRRELVGYLGDRQRVGGEMLSSIWSRAA